MSRTLTPKEIQKTRLELQSLISFSERHLPDSSTPVAQEVQNVIFKINKTIQVSEEKMKAAALLDSDKSIPGQSVPGANSTVNDNIPSFLYPLSTSNDIKLPISTPTEALALFCHTLLLGFEGIVCIAEKSDGGVPGFAAPLAPLPSGTFVPPSWNKNINMITFLYKHKTAPGKKIVLEVSPAAASSTSTSIIKIGFKSTASKPLQLTLDNTEQLNLCSINRCTKPDEIYQLYSDPEGLATIITSSILQALPFLEEEQEKARQREIDEAFKQTPMEVTRDLPPSHLQQSHISRVPPPLTASSSSSSSFSSSSSIGSSDAHPPLPTVVPPPRPGFGPQGQLPSLYDYDAHHQDPQGGTGVGAGGGMLVGPDHPIFQGGFPGHGHGGVGVFPGDGGRGGAPGFGPGMPQPRFDPIINPDIYTDPHLAVGGQGRGGRGGRGRGRGDGAPRVPGESAPDHLKPPDFGDFI